MHSTPRLLRNPAVVHKLYIYKLYVVHVHTYMCTHTLMYIICGHIYTYMCYVMYAYIYVATYICVKYMYIIICMYMWYTCTK